MTPEEANLINRLTEPPPAYDPERCYVPVYRYAGQIVMSRRTFGSLTQAWTKPRGPYVPKDFEILEVIEVKASALLSHPDRGTSA